MARLVSVALCFCLCGCGGGAEDDEWTKDRSKTVPVTATVTMGGSPLSGASVSFLPVLPEGKGASGLTAEDGKLTLTSYEPGDGVVPGEYRVTVVKMQPGAEVSDDPDDPNYGNEEEGEEEDAEVSLIPEKYGVADDSGFLADVTETGANDFTFALEK